MERVEPNINEIVASVVTHYVDLFASTLASGAHKVGQSLRISLKTAFSTYFSTVLQRYSFTKTLLYADEPKYLYSFYVPLDLKQANGTFISNASSRDLEGLPANNLVITGTGGGGKSTLLRHLFLDTVRAHHRVPVFLELRNFRCEEEDLVDFIAGTMSRHGFNLPSEAIVTALRMGAFSLFLDGFDEVTPDRREKVRSQIVAVSERNPRNLFIVSSRPDHELTQWPHFSHFTVAPLTKQKSLELIDKLAFIEDVKRKFAADVERQLYESHKSFVSTPLLLTIMLMTYQHNAEIPNKKHLFYAQIFDTLWNKHDASKEGTYRRRRHTSLAMDDFCSLIGGVLCARIPAITVFIHKGSGFSVHA